DWLVVASPQNAPLALEDRFQFFEDWTSGVGSLELKHEINSYLVKHQNKLTVYVEGLNSFFVTLAEKDKRNYEIRIADWLIDPLTNIPESIFSEEGEVWFVRNRHPDIPSDWPVTLLKTVPKTPHRSVFLYQVNK
ncbi:MAG: hypothetical protein AAB874_00875, partial [Patescibacteria group bacterium]